MAGPAHNVPQKGKPEEAATEETLADGRFGRALLDFGLHSLIGTVIFAIISVPAVLLQFVVVKLESLSLNPLLFNSHTAQNEVASAHFIDSGIIIGLKAAEYALFGTD